MPFLLIIMLLSGPDNVVVQVNSISFSTKARCELAIQNIRANAAPTNVKMYCTEA